MMKQIFIGLGAEFLKIKNTFTYYFTIISAVLIPVLIFIIQLIQPEKYIPSVSTNPWDTLFSSNTSLVATFFIPFYIVLAVALNLNIEHKENAWKKILLLPVSRTRIYVSKIAFILLQILVFLALFLGSIIVSGYILGAVHSELEYLKNTPNISTYSYVLFHLFIALLGMFSIQFILSLFFENIIVPIATGVFATVVAVIMSGWKYAIFYPYAYSSIILQSRETHSFNVIELVSIGIFVTLLLAGAWFFSQKELGKRTKKKTLKFILTSLGIIVLTTSLAGIYKFNYLSGQSGYNVDGNKIVDNKEQPQEINPKFLEQAEEITQFVSKKDAVKFLATEDDYLKRLGEYDNLALFGSKTLPSFEERAQVYEKTTIDWKQENKDEILKAMAFLLQKTEKLHLNTPKKIKIILLDKITTGAYTRGEYIVLPKKIATTQMKVNQIVAHEFFHVYSRFNQDKKQDLYAVLGYKKVPELEYPEKYKHLKFTNPDAPILNYAINFDYKGKKYDFISLHHGNIPYEELVKKVPMVKEFALIGLVESFVAVEEKDGKTLPITENGKLILVEKQDIIEGKENVDLSKFIGKDTNYTLHPEEASADIFAYYVIGKKMKSPEIADRLIHKMREKIRQ